MGELYGCERRMARGVCWDVSGGGSIGNRLKRKLGLSSVCLPEAGAMEGSDGETCCMLCLGMFPLTGWQETHLGVITVVQAADDRRAKQEQEEMRE